MTSATLPILSWPITDKIKLAALGLLGIWIALMANITIIMKGPVQPDTGDAPTDVRAFPSCEGFGCNTLGGRQAGSSVCIITNTNSSGTGSASACFLQSGPRFIISKVSGVVLLNETTLTAANSNVHFFGQTAPGDGLMFQPSGQNRAFNFGGRGSASSAFQDAVFQHFRIRNSPGTGGTSSNAGQDAFNLRKGVHNVIFDHCEIMWTSDEAFNFYHHDDFSIGEGNDTYNLTISRCIIGEGGLAQNYGPLHTSRPGEFQYNISQHHNLIIHTEKRNPKWASATASSTSNNRGIEWVNNVHYNWFSEGVQLQTGVPFWTGGHPLRMDITNNYFRNGPGKNVAVIRLTVFDPTTCASWPNAWQLNVRDNEVRNSDNTVSPRWDADNYNMISYSQGNCGHGPKLTGRITQPPHPVTLQSATDAYTSVVIDEDVGAFPHDAHAQRLVDAPENQDNYNQSLIPPPFGSGSVTFTTYNVPNDSDNDGLPDAYETAIGTDPNVFENHAVIDSDNDGYMNVEDWAHSLSPFTKYQTTGN